MAGYTTITESHNMLKLKMNSCLDNVQMSMNLVYMYMAVLEFNSGCISFVGKDLIVSDLNINCVQ